MNSVRIDTTEPIADTLNQVARLRCTLGAAEFQAAVARLFATLSPAAQRALAVGISLQSASRTLAA